jgi:hypothetical protein
MEGQLPPVAPQLKSSLRSLLSSHASFPLGRWARQFLAGSSWALTPVGLCSLLHKHTPPPSWGLLPDGWSLTVSPTLGFFFLSHLISFPYLVYFPGPCLTCSLFLSLPIVVFLFLSLILSFYVLEHTSSYSVCLSFSDSNQVSVSSSFLLCHSVTGSSEVISPGP